MTRSLPSNTHDRRSGAARLVRLATTALLALAVVGPAVWVRPVSALNADNHCIHDQIQQRVLRSLAPDQSTGSGTLSAVSLPYVAIVDNPTDMSSTVDSIGSDSTAPNVTRSKDWRELRITMSTDNFTDNDRYCTHDKQTVKDQSGSNVTCTAADILTEDKRDILMNSILPEAVRLHTERLKVKQVQSNWTVKDVNGKICGLFNAPEGHRTEGFNNTDLLLYLTSVPSDSGVVAWAAICQVFPDGQPAVGVINIPADKIMSRYDQRVTRVVAHQIAHALGFSDQFFDSPRMKNSSSGVGDGHYTTPVINSNRTVEKARDHYGCPTLQHVEMEKSPVNDSEIFHFLTRNAKDELMAPGVGAGYYTALTMAIFEDTGFYQANYSKAEVMRWGHNAGCDFLNNTCKDNNITQFPQMFCKLTQPDLRCTSSRLDIGKCGVDTHHTLSATAYRYFMTEQDDSSPYTYSCPYVMPEHKGECNLNSSTASDDFEKFNVFSDAARCIDGVFKPKNISDKSLRISGMCANISCDNATNTYSVQVKGSNDYVNCTEGQNITLSNVSHAFETGGYITCPPYAEVCQGNVKAAMDFKADFEKNRGTSSSSGRGDTHTDSMPSSGRGNTPTDSTPSSGRSHIPTDSMPRGGQGNIPTDSMSDSGRGHTPTDSMPRGGQGNTPTDSMPSSGRGNTPTDSTPSSGRGHTPTDSMPSGGRGYTPTDSMPNSGRGDTHTDSNPSNGKGDRLFPLGNGAAGLRSARTLVSAGVALLVVALTVGLSA